ncbi:MAG: hypothetical protein HN380_19680 [Victivallales bacterium]|jgi:hypothetical protein|nr:hypothetical protein [Victivallales bacterium]
MKTTLDQLKVKLRRDREQRIRPFVPTELGSRFGDILFIHPETLARAAKVMDIGRVVS